MKNKGYIILTLLTATLTPPLCAASTFSYNDLNQLTTSESGDNTSIRYDYDTNGNITAVRTITPGDSDGDGLPDVWEQQYFNDLSHEPFEDYDNDGYSNLEEYLAGSDPTDASSIPIQCATTVPDDFTSIQAAANYVAISHFGGNVCVQPGTYVESKLTLQDGVYLVALSDDSAETIIDGDGKDDVITFQGVRIGGVIGFTLRNSKKNGNAAAINITGAKQMPLIARNIITDNRHGIRLQGNVMPLVINNTIVNNTGDGISAGGNSPATILNNIVVSNKGDGIIKTGKAVDELARNDVYDNKGDNYVGIEAGEGGISLDPRFSDGYQLASDSPCIGTGQTPDGEPVDMGAYGGSTVALLNSSAAAMSTDTDQDGIPDSWEYEHFNDLTHDAATDADGDGLNDLDEFQRGTDPNNPDSDNDGILDGWEVNNGLDPLTDDSNGDADHDGFSNIDEYRAETDPQDASSVPIQCATTVPDDFTRIQAAVNYVAITDFGGNVCVRPGTYVEPELKLKDGVYLVALSDDPAETIIDGDGKKNVITFKNVRVGGVIGFTLRNSKSKGNAAGIKVAGGKQMPLIAGNIITENLHGIRLLGNVQPVIITNTIVANSGDGIAAGGKNPAVILNNIVAFNQGDGIVVSGRNKKKKNCTCGDKGKKGSNKGSKGSKNKKKCDCSVDVLYGLSYNDVYANDGGDYVNVEAGEGGISLDPHFSDGYQLASDSPCIGAGLTLEGVMVDMGAYGGNIAPPTSSDYNQDGYTDLLEYLNSLNRRIDR